MFGLKVVKFNEGERESKNITFEEPQFCRLRRLIISSQFHDFTLLSWDYRHNLTSLFLILCSFMEFALTHRRLATGNMKLWWTVWIVV